MTDLLKDMMDERADALETPRLDVLAMVREGERRARRRRDVALGAGVAAAVVAAVGLPQLWGNDLGAPPRAEEPSFTSAFGAHQPSYAIGSEVHVDGRTFDVGRDVFAFVQTTAGVVFADRSGTVWASDGANTVEVGRTDAKNPHLEADGARVAWIEPQGSDGGTPTFQVFDQSTGDVLQTPFDTLDDGPTEYDEELFAVDGTDVYFRDSRGIVRWDVETGDQTSLGRPRGLILEDVKSGVMAQLASPPESGPQGVYFGRSFLEVGSAFWRTFALSPDGRWALGEQSADSPALADTATGEMIALDVPGYEFFVGYGWVDSDTFVGVGLNQPWSTTPADLLECDVAAQLLPAPPVGGGCAVTGPAAGTFEEGLVVPLGEPMDG